jgi:spore coat polysaccharide biosynthesis protein SpsF (cytidylyltransferase family)
MTHVVGIVLARMGSSRYPGKSTALVGGKPMVAHIVERMGRMAGIDRVVLATPDTPEDEALQQVGREAGADVFAGAEEDVLDRLYQAAKANEADLIVHVGGDCPFVDPDLVARALAIQRETGVDYVSNLTPMTYPGGLDIDAITFEALERAWKRAKIRTVRKHPLAYFHQNREEFTIENFENDENLSRLRWTLDYDEDLAFVREVYDHLYQEDRDFVMADILALLEEKPEIGAINAHLSDIVEGQPAYWDSEGYMDDLRDDLRDVVRLGIEADRTGELAEAANYYKIALRLLEDLHGRADALKGR